MTDHSIFSVTGGGIAESLGAAPSMRARIVPMISAALARTPTFDLEIVGWDYVSVPIANPTGVALIVGVAIGIRGYDLAGPGKELTRFLPFSTWQPGQPEIDQVVAAILDGLRETRDAQGRQVNGQ